VTKKKKKEIIFPHLSDGRQLIDTHCHLDMAPYFEDLEEVLSRAGQHGVSRIITVGIDLESSAEAVALAGRYPGIKATVGIHPHNVSDVNEDHYRQLATLAESPEVVAFGEIGLDLYYDFASLEDQQKHFKRQVGMAKELNLPMVIHDRDAHKEVLDILYQMSPFPAGGVMHCFSGNLDFAHEVLELGLLISITGVVTFKKAAVLQDVVAQVPLDKIILETDGPYLAPDPRRGRRNEPALMLFTAQKVAELKGVSLDEVATVTTGNAEKLFKLN